MTNAFITRLPGALTDFDTDDYKVALYGEDATLDADTADYTSTGELSGSGYTAGGVAVEIISPVAAGSDTVVGIEPTSLSAIDLEPVAGLLLYNETKGYSVAVYGCAPLRVPSHANLTIRWNNINGGLPPIRVRS